MNGESSLPVRTALLGTGAWANVLAAAARATGSIELAKVWSRTPARVRTFAETAGIAACATAEEIWSDSSIKAVIIALPNDQHYPFANLAARHGKHVFIEKPIAHTLDDGLRIALLEQEFPVRIVVGHCARLLAGNRLMQDAIRCGELGRVSQIEANFSNDRGLRLTPDDWRWYQSSAPGGPLSQIAIHQFDVLRALGGDIESLSARCARHAVTGAEVEDHWIVACTFADGKLGNVVSSWTSPGTYTVRVTGDLALMHYEIDQSRWSEAQRLHDGATLYRQQRGQGPGARIAIGVPPGDMFCEELAMFAEVVRTGARTQLSADNGCHALAAVEASRISAAQGGRSTTLTEVLADAHARISGARAS